ncbi:MARVEL domain-containing protein 1-like [Lineus longissimus]|uniref:MARVEL domain-containing protein 1-like n=1 Tax=Lineus longissimus TaxID=88925 RepID=UPI002B4C7264
MMEPGVVHSGDTNPAPSDGGMVDTAYIVHPVGILKMVELLLGLIAFACAATPIQGGAVSFFLFASITAWLCTLILFLLVLFRVPAKAGTFPWALMEFIYGIFVVFFYFLASCILAGLAHNWSVFGVSGRLIAAVVFGFFCVICYAIGIYFSFLEWRTNSPSPTTVVT